LGTFSSKIRSSSFSMLGTAHCVKQAYCGQDNTRSQIPLYHGQSQANKQASNISSSEHKR
jgi:hypothetical protein